MSNKSIFSKLLDLAPDLIPVIVQTVIDAERVITGIGQGDIKKGRVMSILKNILETKSYFTDAGSDIQDQILNVAGNAIDLLVMALNMLGAFSTSKKIDFTPVLPPGNPADKQSGRAGLGAIALTLAGGLLLVLSLAAGCGPKDLTPAGRVMYEGPINGGPEGSYTGAADLTNACVEAKQCMGITEELPLPKVRGMVGGNAVECGDKGLRLGCYVPGLVIVPHGGEVGIVSHECVHHWLYLTMGDLDPEHKSEYFLLCGGKFKIDNDTGPTAPEATPAPR